MISSNHQSNSNKKICNDSLIDLVSGDTKLLNIDLHTKQQCFLSKFIGMPGKFTIIIVTQILLTESRKSSVELVTNHLQWLIS